MEDRGYTDARIDQVRAEMQRDLGRVENELSSKIGDVSGKVDALAAEMRIGFAQNAAQFATLIEGLRGVKDDIGRVEGKYDRLEGRIDQVDINARSAKSTIVTTVIGSAIGIVGLVLGVLSFAGDRVDTAFTQGQQFEARLGTIQNSVDAQASDIRRLTDDRPDAGNTSTPATGKAGG